MRKRMIRPTVREVPEREHRWLDIEGLAQAVITSEDEAHPIESAFVAGCGSGWRAAESGKQTLRLLFDEPQRLGLIHLAFREDAGERTQEFVLRWSPDGGRTFHDIARQQYNFSAPDSTREIEDYNVDLDGVTALELSIIPDISGGSSRASLAEWRIA
jgi:hypothetical protein